MKFAFTTNFADRDVNWHWVGFIESHDRVVQYIPDAFDSTQFYLITRRGKCYTCRMENGEVCAGWGD